MDTLEIKTNNVARPIIYACELSKKDWKNLGYEEDEQSRAEQDGDSFIKYKGNIYPLGDFMRLDDNSLFKGWQGYISESFFSGILIKFCQDNDFAIIGNYCS